MAIQIPLQQPLTSNVPALDFTTPPDVGVPWRFFASSDHHQFLCHDVEGWGPTSKLRWDVTPCFLDAWFCVFAIISILASIIGLRHVLSHRELPIKKNLHFYAKLTTIVLIAGVFVSSSVIDLISSGVVVFTDIRFWTPLILTISLGIVFAIQYAEHTRLRYPYGVVLFYWLFLLISLTLKFHSAFARNGFQTDFVASVLLCVSGGLAFLELILEWLVPKSQFHYEVLGDRDECPYDYADIFSVLTFSWITPLMQLGYRKYLTEDHLWDLRKTDQTKTTEGTFRKYWEAELKKPSPSIWKAIFKTVYLPYLICAIFKTLSDVLQFAQPLLLRALISFIAQYRAAPHTTSAFEGIIIALSMFGVSVVQVLCLHQYFQHSMETGMRVRSAMTATIYRKSLRLSTVRPVDHSTGKIVNLMAVDAQKIDDAFKFGQLIWSGPFQIILAVVSLYHLVGWCVFAGLGGVFIMVPLNWMISKAMKRLQKLQMTHKDSRTRLITEILANMKSIKLHAWGPAFLTKLTHIRNDLELRNLRKIGLIASIQNFTWATSPFLVSCFTFGSFVLLAHGNLTADIVFPALALFNLITFPLSVVPMVIAAWIEASVAAERIRKYLVSPEVQVDGVSAISDDDFKKDNHSVVVVDATFNWAEDHTDYTPVSTQPPVTTSAVTGSGPIILSSSVDGPDEPSSDSTPEVVGPALRNLSFVASPGELVCLIGSVGSGKTSVLKALLGDLWRISGKVSMRGSVAYVAQTSWIMNGTVRDNILFGSPYDKARYRRTIDVCDLKLDLKTLPQGDGSLVGERGLTLSGGQKARLALARAVYADAEVYIFDDILSAVDPHVAKHLVNNVLGSNGILANKTRILATHYMPILEEANNIMLLVDGRIHERGTIEELTKLDGDAMIYINSAANQAREAAAAAAASIEQELTESLASSETNSVDGEVAPIHSEAGNERKRRQSVVSNRSNVSHASQAGQSEGGDAEANLPGEVTQRGSVSMEVYADYIKMSNRGGVTVYFLFLIGAQIAGVMTNVWLKRWTEYSDASTGSDSYRNLGVYAALGIGAAALTCGQSLILWLGCSLVASKKMHTKLAKAIFRAPMTFFETTPSGRVLSRFTGDMSRVDGVLPRSFNMLFTSTCRSFATMVVVSIATPVFTTFILPLGVLYYLVQRYFLRTSREVRRLDNATLSPIHDHFQETLNGQSTIRAFSRESTFIDSTFNKVDANVRTGFVNMSTNRWLGVRLEFLGTLVILLSALLSVGSIAAGGGPTAGMVGLALSYALQITNSLNWIVRQSSEVETNLVSVERILEYTHIKPEAPDHVEPEPAPAWPALGDIRFVNYSTRYREDLDLVLKHVNLHFKPKERIGVVGRTGAGKSSLTMALFRIIESATSEDAMNGDNPRIEIDGVDIAQIGLQHLRSRLAIIPQDSSLFHGSIRDNLDPCHAHSDDDLRDMLKVSRLWDHVDSMPGKLDAPVGEHGDNLSHGQRQLISLARALLVPSKILVMDEATSSVDVETDRLIQQTLRSPRMADKTIITIAHRLNTVLDSDRIVVFDYGEVAEFGTPAELIKNKGLFYNLVKDANLLSQVEGPASLIED